MVMTGGMLNQQPDCQRVIKLAPRLRQAGGGRRARRRPRARTSTTRRISRCSAKPRTSSRISSRPGSAASARASSPPRNSRSTSPRRRSRASTCSSSSNISTSASSIRAAARSPANSATSSSSTAASRAPRPTRRCWPSSIALYELGYRGHVDFVDDNLIGNKKALKGFLPAAGGLAEGARFPVRVLDRSLDESGRRRRFARHAAGREFLRRLHRHRKPGSRDAGADQQEAEHPPQHGGEHPQALQLWHVRHRRLHRRLRQREGHRSPTRWPTSSRNARSRSAWSGCSTPCRTRN